MARRGTTSSSAFKFHVCGKLILLNFFDIENNLSGIQTYLLFLFLIISETISAINFENLGGLHFQSFW
jgi:hypothetical protein